MGSFWVRLGLGMTAAGIGSCCLLCVLREGEGLGNGFVWRAILGWELAAEALEAVEIVDGAAVRGARLGLGNGERWGQFGTGD